MSDEWFSEKIAPDGDPEDGCHPKEAEALKNYLRKGISAEEAARSITQPIEKADNPQEDLARLWSFLMQALLELPSGYTDSLIMLMDAIENLPEPKFAPLAEHQRPSEKLWKGLPGFGHFWSDSYMSGDWRRQAKAIGGQEREAMRLKHVKMAEMEARIVTAGLASIPIDWGYEVIADALESSNAIFDFEVPAAAEWLVRRGLAFRRGAEQNNQTWALKPHTTSSSHAPSRNLWTAPWDGIMNSERWALWEQRLCELQMHEGVVGEAAKIGYEAMRKVNAASL